MKQNTLMTRLLLNKIKEMPYEKMGFAEVYSIRENWLFNELGKIKTVYRVQNVADFESALQTKSDLLVSAYLINKPALSAILERQSRMCRIYYGCF